MLTESIIEDAAMKWFGESSEQVVLVDRLRTSAWRLNQALAGRDIGTRSFTELIGVIKLKRFVELGLLNKVGASSSTEYEVRKP